MNARAGVPVATFFGAMLLVGTTRAAEPSAADRETSRSLFVQGTRSLDAGDFAVAERECGGAYALVKAPTAATCWARALAGLGRLIEARDVFIETTHIPVRPDEPAVFTNARETARTEADGLAKRIPTVTVAVSGPSEATSLRVAIDGVSVATKTARLPRKLNPGHHAVLVAAPGFVPTSLTVDVSEGEDRRLDVALTPSRSTDEPAATPATVHASVGGSHAGDLRMSEWIAFGVGGAGLIVGTVAGVAGFASAGNAKSHCSGNACPPDAQGPISDAKAWATASDVGFVVAGVGAAVGVGLVLWGRPASESSGVGVALGPGSVRLEGTW